jgi:hypothetical protein
VIGFTFGHVPDRDQHLLRAGTLRRLFGQIAPPQARQFV